MKKPDFSPKALYNPLAKEFSVVWFDDQNKPKTLKIRRKTYKEFPIHQYEFVRRHLADFIINNTEGVRNVEEEREKIYKRIEFKP